MIATKIVENFIQDIPHLQEKGKDFWSRSKDIFYAILQTYNQQEQNWLFGAIISEIGFNTFDHNFVFPDNSPRGLYVDFSFNSDYVVLLDFGRGIKDSLLNVKPSLTNDLEALQIAFTEVISGRSPEQRGNGLKFVVSSVVNNQWNMYYQSGNAICTADKSGFSFTTSNFIHNGCFCILSTEESK